MRISASDPNLLLALLRGGIDLIYPNTCLGCGTRCGGYSLPLCTTCRAGLERAEPEEVWERLNRLPEARGLFEHAYSLWTFDAGITLQTIQHRLKYGQRPSFGVQLGRLVATGYAKGEISPPSMVIPIPLHPSRYLERGYNQSERLGTGIAGNMGVEMRTDLLVRRRATKSQTLLAREERWRNVDGAFAITDENALQGEHVLLVDDVLTTGATLSSAARCVQPVARAVSLATLAMART